MWNHEHWFVGGQGESIEMEKFFSQLTLDIIGKAVFNYDFDSLTHDDEIIQVTLARSLEIWTCRILKFCVKGWVQIRLWHA